MPDLDITLTPSASDVEALRRGMREHELSAFPDLPDESEDVAFYAFVRGAADKPVAGIKANVFWDGVEIDTLWVAADQRRAGLGSELLRAAEQFGRERGCVVAYLKTVSATEFYERHDYSVFGVLEDRPIGSKLFYMKKRLDEAPR